MKMFIALISVCLISSLSSAVESISPLDAADRIEKSGFVLVDVRERDELIETGIARHAIWLAKSTVDAKDVGYTKFLEQHDKKTALIFYCRSGKRAGVVAAHFETLGYKAFNMGGFDGWKKAGLPVVEFK